MAKPFYFKQFSVKQDRCAMKIGTDAVLLGAWTNLDRCPKSILDIGAGTGILALMMAQRSNAEVIDAVEVDAEAYEQCVDNFEGSDWGDRLFCYHASLKEFADEIDDKYDLIISNPPFYREQFKTTSKARNKARFEDALPFDKLLSAASKLLNETGQLNVIIPFSEQATFVSLAKNHRLFPSRILHLKGRDTSPIKRSLICFIFQEESIDSRELTLEISRHQYTREYQNITKDFYLKM
jgi:tRNA1Val (adenine37-N6)-methyltransferase